MKCKNLLLLLTLFGTIFSAYATNPGKDDEYNFTKKINDEYSFANYWTGYVGWFALSYVAGLVYPIQPFSLPRCYAAYRQHKEKSKLPLEDQPLFFTYYKNNNIAEMSGLTLGLATLVTGAGIGLFKMAKLLKNNKIVFSSPIQIVPR